MRGDLLELTSHCIRCGLCLESCPTFGETGVETDGPRGRIYLVRSAVEGKLVWSDVTESLDRCLGCRACETACPSAVQYGAILELARTHLHQPLAKRLLLKTVTTPKLLQVQLKAPVRRMPVAISKLLTSQAPQADLPRLPDAVTFAPLDEASLPPVRGEVVLLHGCAMGVLYPQVHEATRRLLRRVGYSVREVDLGCCGALHAHNGDLSTATGFAQRLIDRAPPGLPVIVNSAGCGSMMKEYEDSSFASRVFDATEFLLREGLAEVLANGPGLDLAVTYHDACHLAHGQKITQQPRELIRAIPRMKFVELPESDRCCGSAGIYNVLQPLMSRQLLERKWRNVEATGAQVVATGNPGCHAWIAQAAREHGQSVSVVHTLELFEQALA